MQLDRKRQYLWITIGTIIMTVGVYFFKFPNNFCTGGVSGISLILGKLLRNFTPGSMVMIINGALLVLGFLLFGKLRRAHGVLQPAVFRRRLRFGKACAHDPAADRPAAA